LDKVVEEYNKYHGAEAQVKVLKHYGKQKRRLLTRFRGPFCVSCAPDEYYVDLQILLEETIGLKFKIGSIKPENNGATVEFEYSESEQAPVYLSHL